MPRQGPLAGVKIVEFAGIGPGPFAAMLLADMGATVVRLDRPEPSGLGSPKPRRFDLLLRSRPTISVDLKREAGVRFALDLVSRADMLIEGFRPGTMERLGLGPDQCLARRPSLIYGRMTGWGQQGPYAPTAGHDLNYIALTGALHSIGRAGQPPTPPLNLVGDFGGGSLYLAMGMLAALVSARATGQGQVVDAAIVDGAASLLTSMFGSTAAGLYDERRGHNMLDSGAPFYDVYECRDGRWLSVAAIEGKFRRELYDKLDLPADTPDGSARDDWAAARAAIAARLRERTRDEWEAVFAGSDACVAPVLSMPEALAHPHARARQAFVDVAGVPQPAPAPRFSATPNPVPTAAPVIDADLDATLGDWGYAPDAVRQWQSAGAIGVRDAARADQ